MSAEISLHMAPPAFRADAADVELHTRSCSIDESNAFETATKKFSKSQLSADFGLSGWNCHRLPLQVRACGGFR